MSRLGIMSGLYSSVFHDIPVVRCNNSVVVDEYRYSVQYWKHNLARATEIHDLISAEFRFASWAHQCKMQMTAWDL